MGFGDDLRKEADNVIEAAQVAVKLTSIHVFSYAVESSPVGNFDLWKSKYKPVGYVGGRFRSNWFLSRTGVASSKTTQATNQESSRIDEIDKLLKAKYVSKYILSNNLDYAEALEGGHSTQAPNGIASPAITEGKTAYPLILKTTEKKYGVN